MYTQSKMMDHEFHRSCSAGYSQ